MNLNQIMGIIRAALIFAGGILITTGTISAALEQQILGSALTLIATIWSILSKTPVTDSTSPDPVVRMLKR